MTLPILTLEAAVDGCAADFCLNDVPLARLAAPDSRRVVIPVNEWVIEGNNRLEVVVEPGPTPTTARRGDRPASDAGMVAVARVVRHQPNAFPGEDAGPRLATVEFHGDGRERSFPEVQAGSFASGPSGGPWQWERADPLALDGTTAAEVRRVVERVKALLRARDFEGLVALKRIALSDRARAYGEDVEAYVETMRTFAEQSWADLGWSIADLDEAVYDLRLVAGGRLVECNATDGRPVVRSGNGRSRFPLRLGRIQGAWHQLG